MVSVVYSSLRGLPQFPVVFGGHSGSPSSLVVSVVSGGLQWSSWSP